VNASLKAWAARNFPTDAVNTLAICGPGVFPLRTWDMPTLVVCFTRRFRNGNCTYEAFAKPGMAPVANSRRGSV
jgi:hypothetical protein